MKINIEKAEEIISYGQQKKTGFQYQKSLEELIETVKQKRQQIEQTKATIDLLLARYEHQQTDLERNLTYLTDRSTQLDQSLSKIHHQHQQLSDHHQHLKQVHQIAQTHAHLAQLKKQQRERHYHTLPKPLSILTKRRYLKARDAFLKAEQELSESRIALDESQVRLVSIAQAMSRHQSEQAQMRAERRGSVETLETRHRQVSRLCQLKEFWDGFDVYQAQVVLESAEYLKERPRVQSGLDITQVWVKTFLLACFEYGEREAYAEQAMVCDVEFDCALCRLSHQGWPNRLHQDLTCDVCFSVANKKQPQSILSLKKISSSIFKHQDTKLRKFLGHLFNSTHTKINPI